jgi:hypothetical protein
MRHGAFEDLLVMPGDVHDVHRRLARHQKRLTCERIDCPARLVPGDIRPGHADLPVLGDADGTQVEQRVVERASPGAFGISSGPSWLCQRTCAAWIPTG